MKLHIHLKYSDACIAYVKIEKHIQFNVFSVFGALSVSMRIV